MPFARKEHDARLAAVRRAMAERDLELCLLSSPENIFYLTGLDHWGYFAPHLLLVPAEGELVLVARAMERVTVANQVANARFVGHADHETVADKVLGVIAEAAMPAARIGLEAWSAGLPHGLAEALRRGLPNARWVDASWLIDDLRMVKSPVEQALMREAARVSDATAAAAIEAIGAGASEGHVAARAYAAMIEAGGTYPGFGPFIRPASRLGEEHTSWGDGSFAAGDPVFLELSGCVARYHAPLGRLIHVGAAAPEARGMAAVCREAFAAVVDALRPGTLARDVYAAWQRVVDRAGLGHYRRHHCGYVVGVGCPPSWTGGNRVVGLRHDSGLEIRPGMSFHVISWLMGTGRGDFFVSDTVLLGASGPEVLTRTPTEVIVR
ncbi:MAG TPA: Xaa-Pro peptidase family protein [Geminicoccaceae bacterium]|nr:Xaa-Pro peptidase family protein [Geminicoccaceae bacterium]